MIRPTTTVRAAFRQIVIATVVMTSVATLALILVVLILPARAALALHWYLVAVGAIVVVAAIRTLIARYPVRWRAALDPIPRAPTEPPEIPARLRAISRLVSRAQWDPVGFDQELRPMLRAIAAQRLATYHLIDLERNPEAARGMLGERVWAFLMPTDVERVRGERNVELADLGMTVEALEKLHDSPDD